MTKPRTIASLANGISSNSVEFVQAGAPQEDERSLTSKLGELVSVKDFGAVGDGFTDDSAAIQSACDAVANIYFPPGTYVCKGLQINNSIQKWTLDPNATIQDLVTNVPGLVVPGSIEKMPETIVTAEVPNGVFIIEGGTIDFAGERYDGVPFTKNGGLTTNTPFWSKPGIFAKGLDRFEMRGVTFKRWYARSLPNVPYSDEYYAGVCSEDCKLVRMDECGFENCGQELTILRDKNPEGSKVCSVSITGMRNINNLSSVNVDECLNAVVDRCFINGSNGSAFNILCNNTVFTNNYVTDIINSSAIDFSEGLYRARSIVCSNNILSDLADFGVLASAYDVVISNNVITNARGGILNNLAQAGLAPYPAEANTVISNNVIRDSSDFGIYVNTVASSSPNQVSGVTISANQIDCRNVTPGAAGCYGIRVRNCGGVSIIGNDLNNIPGNYIEARLRVDSLSISGNLFRRTQIEPESGKHLLYFDQEVTSLGLNNISISNNSFLTAPGANAYSVFFTNYSHGANEFRNIVIRDNDGPVLYKAEGGSGSGGGGIAYSAVKSTNVFNGTAPRGTFNGGDTVQNSCTAAGQVVGWRILTDDNLTNSVYTYAASNPTSTASSTAGSNVLTMSSNSHGIKAGEAIRIVGAGVSAGNLDGMVIYAPLNSNQIWLRTNASTTASGLSVQYLGNVTSKNVSLGTL